MDAGKADEAAAVGFGVAISYIKAACEGEREQARFLADVVPTLSREEKYAFVSALGMVPTVLMRILATTLSRATGKPHSMADIMDVLTQSLAESVRRKEGDQQ